MSGNSVEKRKIRFYPILAALIGALAITLLAHGAIANAVSHGARAQQQEPTGSAAATRVLESSAQGLTFVLELPALEIGENASLTVPGLQQSSLEPGAPALPGFTTFIALPPGARASVAVSSSEPAVQQTVGRIAPAPQSAPIAAPSAGDENLDLLAAQSLPTRSEASPHIYESDQLYPGELYSLSEPVYYRDLRLVRLELYPIQYNPVQGVVASHRRLEVTVSFSAINSANGRPVAGGDAALEAIAPMVLNFEQGRQWRSLPDDFTAPQANFPINRDTFRIAVDQDGIYELTYQALAAAGMDVENVDPNTIEMMYRGQAVAYQLVNDNGDSNFDAQEKIRFYGWAFDGSRLERQFLTENVYWLWAGGSPTRIADVGGASGDPLAESFRESITREPDIAFTHVWTDQWDDAPNEPDAWIWERVAVVETAPDWPRIERVHEITLPAPLDSGSPAKVTVELLSREARNDHDVFIYMNGDESLTARRQWTGARSVNVELVVPAGELLEGVNEVHIVYQTPVTAATSSGAQALYYMNRITVDYDRRFETGEQQLIFDGAGGPSRYQIAGFANGSQANVLVWELSDRLQPRAIRPGDITVSGSGPYSYAFGSNAAGAQFIATHTANTRQPLSIEKYVGPDLDPAQGASWLVISHANFMAQAQTLAAHRRQPIFGGYSTHIVDVHHIINQYGYGLPIPDAIRRYLQHALAEWPVAPQHLLLMGDGHINPRQIPCNEGNTQCSHWSTEPETNYVLTDIVFGDRYVGINASDYSYSLLVGDDLIPDITVGRLPVQSPTEARNIINKIIHFETVRLEEGAWQKGVLFIADDDDSAGQFCNENQVVADQLPADYVATNICLPSNAPEDIEQTRIEIYEAVNNPPDNGATFLNYRGHGAVRAWAGNLINLDAPGTPWKPFTNNEPLIILSMDCLDGYFAQPGVEALSEVFMAEPDYGSAAHWSSTGFGTDSEHRVLHRSFYDGVFDHHLSRIGDAINYAKLQYVMESRHPSQLYSFVLQGDPAMRMVTELTHQLYLPALNG